MLSVEEIKIILNTITQHAPEAPESEINATFQTIIENLHKLPIFTSDGTPNQYLSFEQIQSKTLSEFCIDFTPLKTLAIKKTACLSETRKIKPTKKTILQTSYLSPTQPTVFLPSTNKISIKSPHQQEIEKALKVLQDYNFTEGLLRSFIRTMPIEFKFLSEHYNTLIYLVTGQHPVSKPHEKILFQPLTKQQCLLPKQALEEIRGLNVFQLNAIERLFAFKLSGGLLRILGPRNFTKHHGVLLHYLIKKREPSFLVGSALSQIQDLNAHGAKTALHKEKKRTEERQLSRPKR